MVWLTRSRLKRKKTVLRFGIKAQSGDSAVFRINIVILIKFQYHIPFFLPFAWQPQNQAIFRQDEKPY